MQPCRALMEDDLDLVFQKAIRDLEDVLSTRRRSLYQRAYTFLGNAADAEDAVQDALLSAYEHLGGFRGESHMSTWLTAIVSNSARMRLRKRSIRQLLSLDDRIGKQQEYSLSEQLAHPGPTPEDEYRQSELTTRIADVLLQLSPPLRKALQLRDLDGLTTSEAAGTLGIPVGTLKAQLSRARRKMKRLMTRMLDTRHNQTGIRNRHYRRPTSPQAMLISERQLCGPMAVAHPKSRK
jgi:RNA polymerase sigma-70 factor, ECF subfamily